MKSTTSYSTIEIRITKVKSTSPLYLCPCLILFSALSLSLPYSILSFISVPALFYSQLYLWPCLILFSALSLSLPYSILSFISGHALFYSQLYLWPCLILFSALSLAMPYSILSFISVPALMYSQLQLKKEMAENDLPGFYLALSLLLLLSSQLL